MRQSLFQRPVITPSRAAAASATGHGEATPPIRPERTSPAPVAPEIARALRRAAGGAFRPASQAATRNVDTTIRWDPASAAGGMPASHAATIETEVTPSPRKQFFSRPDAEPGAQPETEADELFHRRVTLQRASNAWGSLIAEWHAASEATRGSWSLPELMRAIRQEGLDLAREIHPDAAGDERIVATMTRMIAQGVAGELRSRERLGRTLDDRVPHDVRLSLHALVEEPPTRILRDPRPGDVHVRGVSSLTISIADVSARLLPALAPHAGLGTREALGDAIELLRLRADELTERALPPNAPGRDRQSLFQSFLRREATLMAASLEGLPSAGPASVAHGRTLLDAAFDRYREWSKAMAEEIERKASIDRKPVNAPENPPAAPPPTNVGPRA